tara:strand:- start:654 stop:830 length:177 start_codon:yes stop_codon:yes gene_type:complete
MKSRVYVIVGIVLLAMALKMSLDEQFLKALMLIIVSIISLSIAGIMINRRQERDDISR